MTLARFAAALFLLVLTSAAAAQQQPPGGPTGGSGGAPRGIPTRPAPSIPTGPTELQVRVTLNSDFPVDNMQLRVELLSMGSVPIASTYTDTSGRARLQVERPGQYRIRVSGIDIEDTISDEVMIMPAERMRMEYVRVKLRENSELARKLHGGFVSAASLNVPKKAKKEFEKGNEALADQKWGEAIERFENAVREYPEYDSAFNHLGVAYMRSGDSAKGREAFEKAVTLNDKNATAQLNLARILVTEKKLEEAETRAQKAVSLMPANPDALTLLAVVQITSGKLDDALATSRKVHEVPQHEGYAVAHLIAGRAYEAKKQQADAVREYQLFLKEAPKDPRGNDIREAVARLGGPAPAQ